MRKKYILFDNDGVLVDTEYWYYMATKQALSEVGIHIDRDQFMTYMVSGKTTWDLARSQGVDEETIQNKMVDRTRYYQNCLRTEDIEIPGVEEVLKELSQTYKMAIITTSHREDFEVIHKDRSIAFYMDFVLVREDYINSKPDPEPYLAGLNKFGANPEQALVVEDSERGLVSALAAGIDCVVVHNDFTKSHDFSKATYKIKNLDELPRLLKEHGQTLKLP
ncbi:MAG: HAD family phosphatase [Verrucomicrobia bacterium]|nr:HAD family phosphatase [Verrucomicrobiota bacterium]MDA1069487.1 HAD family phosphatase [Verrucomicrobiota bacterium]